MSTISLKGYLEQALTVAQQAKAGNNDAVYSGLGDLADKLLKSGSSDSLVSQIFDGQSSIGHDIDVVKDATKITIAITEVKVDLPIGGLNLILNKNLTLSKAEASSLATSFKNLLA